MGFEGKVLQGMALTEEQLLQDTPCSIKHCSGASFDADLEGP